MYRLKIIPLGYKTPMDVTKLRSYLENEVFRECSTGLNELACSRPSLAYGFRRFITSCQVLWPLRVSYRPVDPLSPSIFHILPGQLTIQQFNSGVYQVRTCAVMLWYYEKLSSFWGHFFPQLNLPPFWRARSAVLLDLSRGMNFWVVLNLVLTIFRSTFFGTSDCHK